MGSVLITIGGGGEEKSTLANVSHLYYMCDIHVIHV